jgi:hypothetical protein
MGVKENKFSSNEKGSKFIAETLLLCGGLIPKLDYVGESQSSCSSLCYRGIWGGHRGDYKRRLVRWKATDVSQENVTSIFRVKEKVAQETGAKADWEALHRHGHLKFQV